LDASAARDLTVDNISSRAHVEFKSAFMGS